MDAVRSCRECGNNERCRELIRKGMIPYCGSSLCKPVHKEVRA